MKWTRLGRTISPEGTDTIYGLDGTDITVESRKRHIPHSGRTGTWDHTTYIVVDKGRDIIERYTLQDAKEYAEMYLEEKKRRENA